MVLLGARSSKLALLWGGTSMEYNAARVRGKVLGMINCVYFEPESCSFLQVGHDLGQSVQ